MNNVQKVRAAVLMLREARNLLKEAGASRSVARVRNALKSAEGAERHAQCMANRSQADPIASGNAVELTAFRKDRSASPTGDLMREHLGIR